jgi:hypothetical protein
MTNTGPAHKRLKVISAAGLSGLSWAAHPTVLSRRRRDLLATALAAGAAGLIGLAIAIKVPEPNLFVAAGVIFGALGLFALGASVRYEITLTILVIYLGLIDGVVKLETASQLVSSLRDVMIAAISMGALARVAVRREKVLLPPLTGWVFAFVLLVVIEVANPNTHGLLKVVGGFRQHLEWIPFFFFGYLIMRSKVRFRQLFLLLGVIALANGFVSTVQTQLTPEQLASWGPGYAERINGTGSVSDRVYTDSAGTARVRPPALGSDFGFGGYVGVLALPGLLALLATGRLKRRSLVLLLSLGAILAVATSLQREAVLGAVVAVIAFAALSASAGRQATRVLAGLLVVGALALALASLLAPNAGNGVFSRYASITPDKAAATSVSYRQDTLAQIPAVVQKYPFGAGLSIAGAGATFGGESTATVDGHRASAESQYNYVNLELGLPGLLFWIALTVMVITLSVRKLRQIGDVELRLSLAAVFAVVIAFSIMGLVGPTMSSLPFGPFFWFSVGIASYWFAGGLQRQQHDASRTATDARPIPAAQLL